MVLSLLPSNEFKILTILDNRFVMIVSRRGIFIQFGFLFRWLWLRFSLTKLTLFSLLYNDFADKYYIGDSCMEPMFWIVDHFTKILGPICVVAVILLFSSLVIIAYAIGLPFYLKQSYLVYVPALIIGHWLLLNVLFYYCMAYITNPGYPPQGAMITEAVSICKRCISPKPPRTHHCVVCNRCILKMDHHCPWLNNCVGHYNHRYFFMFCAYTWIGIVFVIIFGIPVFYCHFSVCSEKYGFSPHLVSFIEYLASRYNSNTYELKNINNISSNSLLLNKWPENLYHTCVIYATLLCVAVLCVLGGLLAWHARLISNGETSIEGHINKRETKRFLKEGKVYKNPYDFGAVNNWKIFLCIGHHRRWWNLLIPFIEKPAGDGIKWNILSIVEKYCPYLKHDVIKTDFVKIA